MCGIVGLAYNHSQEVPNVVIEKAVSAITHRCQEEGGIKECGKLPFGYR